MCKTLKPKEYKVFEWQPIARLQIISFVNLVNVLFVFFVSCFLLLTGFIYLVSFDEQSCALLLWQNILAMPAFIWRNCAVY